jgi:hypothetical protein
MVLTVNWFGLCRGRTNDNLEDILLGNAGAVADEELDEIEDELENLGVLELLAGVRGWTRISWPRLFSRMA